MEHIAIITTSHDKFEQFANLNQNPMVTFTMITSALDLVSKEFSTYIEMDEFNNPAQLALIREKVALLKSQQKKAPVKRKIYVASSWKNQVHGLVVDILLAMGHEVFDYRKPTPGTQGFSDWTEVMKQLGIESWKECSISKYVDALNHEAADLACRQDLAAMHYCDTCILVMPSGASAHLEAGWMKGQGKQVYVLMFEQDTPELMHKIFDGIITNVDDLKQMFSLNV